MIQKENIPELISAEEAAAISYRAGTISSMDRAREIMDAYLKLEPLTDDQKYYAYCVLATIYDAGRIQGIREERLKRKNKNNL